MVSTDPALQVLRRSPASQHRIPDRILEIIADCLNKNGLDPQGGGVQPLSSKTSALRGPSQSRVSQTTGHLDSASTPHKSRAENPYAAVTMPVTSTLTGPLTDWEKVESSLGLSDTDEDLSLSHLHGAADFDDTASIASLTEEKSLLQKELQKASQLLSKMTREREDIGSKYIAVSEQVSKVYYSAVCPPVRLCICVSDSLSLIRLTGMAAEHTIVFNCCWCCSFYC